jgi:hypothetical protein
MPTQPNQIITRLASDVYRQLERKFSKPIVTTATTPIEVAYQLGVQAVLQELRNGFTIDS